MFTEKDIFILDSATFTPETGKSVLLSEIEVMLYNHIEEYAHLNGFPIRILSSKPGAIPQLKKGQRGSLQFVNGISHFVGPVVVDSCEPVDGKLVLIAESVDGTTIPHAVSVV